MSANPHWTVEITFEPVGDDVQAVARLVDHAALDGISGVGVAERIPAVGTSGEHQRELAAVRSLGDLVRQLGAMTVDDRQLYADQS